MIVARTRAALRDARAKLGTVGLVPTMGFLHEGHLSLVRRARDENKAVVVSIFVNPTQFGPNEDLSRYPRDLDRDLAMLREAGVAVAFVPDASEIYPEGFGTRIEVGDIALPLEGAVRPGHFSGVATVVCKLINLVAPERVYFGQKDAQQCAVLRRMILDLDLPVRMVVAPTVREADGLALSSRNSYLDAAARVRAAALHRALRAAEDAFLAGERRADRLRARMEAVLAGSGHDGIDYLSVADPDTLRELEAIEHDALLSLAVRFGATRLIDNLVLDRLSGA
ncbi:pantoate--beta-alanine ligase [Acetobacteraceae bacterium KSS8]|uniref:Pantothenate synthetase n=1 Tax=Endosaccharibacter trunci TaxID=2812733 RepID=A0ABT1W857_9PROT|nr:pantoate--beta-alanine ligase [Acetobacteraceae bacterium KSS8]